MATISLRRWEQAHSLLWSRWAGVSLTAWIFVACATIAFTGLLWDGGWHASWGRDTFFIPPHDMLYMAVTGLFVVASVILISTRQLPGRPDSAGSLSFRAPIGIWIVFVGCMTLFVAAPIDEWYHRTFGVDNGTGLWSPPHFLGMLGGLVGCLGILLLLRTERADTAGANDRPRGLRHLSANDALSLLMFSYVTLIVGGLSLNFWASRQWYRTDGTLYPWLGLLFGPAVLIIAQRVTRRAGAATVAFLIPFLLIGVIGAILTAAHYPIVVSLPVMALPSAILLDLFYARYGSGYRWLLAAGPLNALAFYGSEYLWAWYVNGHPWASVTGALWMLPVAIVTSTASLLLGAWLVEKVESVGYFRRELA